MTKLTFKHLSDDSFETIVCKRWYPSRNGLYYVTFDGELIELPYQHTTDMILFCVE